MYLYKIEKRNKKPIRVHDKSYFLCIRTYSFEYKVNLFSAYIDTYSQCTRISYNKNKI